MKSWLKNIFADKSTARIDQSVAAILYPDKILIITRHKAGPGIWFETDSFTSLPSNANNELIGETIIQRLADSKYSDISPKGMREFHERLLAKAKFKNNDAKMTNAKLVSVFKTNVSFSIEPKENNFSDGKEKAFLGMPNDKIIVDPNIDPKSLGHKMKLAWDKCLIT